MSKKTKRAKHRANTSASFEALLKQQLRHSEYLLDQGNFAGVLVVCEPLLHRIPKNSPLRVELLSLLGLAHAMLQHYEESYDIFTEAVTLEPKNAELWFNRGLASHYTTRVGQAVRDFERAVQCLGTQTGPMTDQMTRELEVSRSVFQEALQEQGGLLSLDQYIEREELYMQGVSSMKHHKYREGETAFRQLLDKGGKEPQYWGNLAVSLMMQQKYDEAEMALKRALEIDPGYELALSNLEKLPVIRQEIHPLDLNMIGPSSIPQQNTSESLQVYRKNSGNSSIVPHKTIEKNGDTVNATLTPFGKQTPSYSFFLNPYKDVRFTTCPRCGTKTKQRKFTLVTHVDPEYAHVMDKMCRYCFNCDLLIVHQDQLEEQLTLYFSHVNPDIIGNDYTVIGTLKLNEWKQDKDNPSIQEMLEHLHDFKEVVTFRRVSNEHINR